MGKFLSMMLLEEQLFKNIISERLWVRDAPDGSLPKQLVFDSSVPDVQDKDVILTSGKFSKSDLYVVGSPRLPSSKNDNKVFTYAPFQRNPHVDIDKDAAKEVFKALKGQSKIIKMPDADRQQLLDRGAQMINEKIIDLFKHDITHVVTAPSSSPLAKDFASACMQYIDKKDPEKFFPFKLAKNFPNSYRKADDLNKIHVSPEMFDYTLKNIIEKEPEIDHAIAKKRAKGHVDDAEVVLKSAKDLVTRMRAKWDKEKAINPNLEETRPDFSVSEIPHQYRVWIDGFIEPDQHDELKNSSPKIVAVVDDNVDSGHTVFQIAKQLYEMGAEQVVGVALYKFRLSSKAKGKSKDNKSAAIDHSKKFWSERLVKAWTKEECILAKSWLLSMTGKAEKLKIKVPPFDFGFKEKYTGKEEEYISRVNTQLEKLRTEKIKGESMIKIKKSSLQKMIREAMNFGRDDYPAADDFTPEVYEPAIPHRPCKTCCGFGGGTVGEDEEICADCEGTGLQRAEVVVLPEPNGTPDYEF